MPTTTNFGWTTPADTDLVKDGAAAIRTLGNGVDTSFLDLKGGTTGQLLSKTSNTDLDFTWTTPAAGGGLTLISTTNYTSGSAALTISSIPTTYKNIYVLWSGFYPSADTGSIFLRVNADTGSNYVRIGALGNQYAFATSFALNHWTVPTFSTNIAYRAVAWIQIPNYATTSTGKIIDSTFTTIFDAATANNAGATESALYIGTSAITSISLNTGTGTWNGGVALLYGEN
jgi:hypothetical protein